MNYRRKKRRNNFFKKIFFYLIVIGSIFYGTQYHYTNLMLQPVDLNDKSNISFEISKGENLTKISNNLKQRNLIKSQYIFKKYLQSNKLDKEVKAGNFILKRTMSSQEIAKQITSDTITESAITIQEGLTIVQIDEKLTRAGLIQPGDLINFNISNLTKDQLKLIPKDYLEILQSNNSNLEGLLFPDTYFINKTTFNLNKFIIRLIQTMDKKIDDNMKEAYKNSNRTLYEILKMASILEKEVSTTNDLPIVSGILWKRYDANWQIGADATLLYVTEKQTINKNDLELESAYNTRKFLGLPPTPISSPGIESIKASIFPKDSDYWYYLTTLDTGEVIYSRTNEEHNLNREKYL